MKRIAVFGGAFNPPTAAHAEIIRTIVDRDEYDFLLVAPSYKPPHKDAAELLDITDRIEMLKLMLSSMHSTGADTQVIITDIEDTVFDQTGGYTYDLLSVIKENMEYEIDLVIGEDQLNAFATWKDNAKILEEYGLIVFTRDSGSVQFPEGVDLKRCPRMPIVLRKKYESMSSSEIRKAIKEHKDIDGLCPAVADLIKKRGWYSND